MRLLRFNDAQLHTAILFMQSILQMSAKQLHGIFHLRTSAAGTINPTLCPHLPPTLGVSHRYTHKRATPLVLSNERRGKNLANPLDTLRQILLLTRGKKFMVRSAISPNDDSLPPFPMMWSHLLGGVLFRRDVLTSARWCETAGGGVMAIVGTVTVSYTVDILRCVRNMCYILFRYITQLPICY